MQRMTDVLSRMLNDPATRAALCGGGEDSLEGVIDQQDNTQNTNENVTESNEERQDNETERVERPLTEANQEKGIFLDCVVHEVVCRSLSDYRTNADNSYLFQNNRSMV